MYTAYAADRDYSRLIEVGDQALSDDLPFQALEAYSGAIVLRPGFDAGPPQTRDDLSPAW